MERRELKGKDWRMKRRDLIDDIRRIIVYLTHETMVFNGELEWKRKKEENSSGSDFPELTVSLRSPYG